MGHSVQPPPVSLHTVGGRRKYLTPAERARFLQAAAAAPARVETLCLALIWTGCRITEALNLTHGDLDREGGTVAVRTLKKRRDGVTPTSPPRRSTPTCSAPRNGRSPPACGSGRPVGGCGISWRYLRARWGSPSPIRRRPVILEHRFAHVPQDARRGRAWLANLAPLYEGMLAEGVVVPPSAYLRYYHLGEIVLAVEAGPAQVIERTQRLVAMQSLDHLVLRAHADGRTQITAGPRCTEVSPGDLALLDLARPIRVATPSTTAVSVVVPRRVLGLEGRGYDADRWHGSVLTGDGDRNYPRGL